jgi:DNA-directed RNA polymerase subunit M/transcription elongation factor TFIIS
MGEITIGQRDVDTDVRRWDPDLRRDASLVLGALAGVFLLAALVYYALNAAGSGWFLWVAIVVLALLLVAEAVVLVTGIATEENVGPPWLSGEQRHATTTAAGAAVGTEGQEAEPEPEHEREPEPEPEHREIDLECPECSQMFAVEDTGERPLATECPHCGARGHVNLPEPEEDTASGTRTGAGAAAAGADPLAGLGEDDEEPDEDVETISLECPACDTQFETEDTGERPLRTECPGCGRSGKLG